MNIKLVIFWIALSIVNCENTCGEFCTARSPTIRDTFFITLGTYAGNDKFGSFYQKIYYYPRYVKANWLEAKLICSAYNLEFASFKTIEEANAVVNMSKTIDFDWIFIDGISLTPKSKTDWYLSETGEKIDYIIPWLPGQPTTSKNAEFALCFGKFTKDGPIGFNDAPLRGSMHYFLCQKTI